MASLIHELWDEANGEQTFCLAGPHGAGARSLLTANARLVWTVEASSHYEAMTAYYQHMGWRKYDTSHAWDLQPYPEAWRALQRAGIITCSITFFSKDRGGRQRLPNLSTVEYRPHLRVAGASQLLGVVVAGTASPAPEVPIGVQVVPLYPDHVDYSSLQGGQRFEVVEGIHTVGEGVVISVVSPTL
jgi:hypothetical protein